MSGFDEKGADARSRNSAQPHFHGHRERLKQRFADSSIQVTPLEIGVEEAGPR